MPVPEDVRIERLESTHPSWQRFLAFADERGEGTGLDAKTCEYHSGPFTLVAHVRDKMVGYLRFWTQQIGIDEDTPGLERNERPVLEAKVVAFFVKPQYRRPGIGRCLKQTAVSWARDLDCYQVRERSCYRNIENHALNMSLGFGIQPAVNEDESDCSASFMLPVNTHETASVIA